MRSLVKLALGAWLLCGGAGQALAERPFADNRASELLSPVQGQALVDLALRHEREFHPKPDCSHLVHKIYSLAGLNYEYAGSRDIYYGAEGFDRVFIPQPGDLIVWLGHVGIVVAPDEQTFFSSVRSGIVTESWTADYWQERGRPRFYRYRISPATDQVLLAALTPRLPAQLESDDDSDATVLPGSSAVRSSTRPDSTVTKTNIAKTTAATLKAPRPPVSAAAQPSSAAGQSNSATARAPITTSSRPPVSMASLSSVATSSRPPITTYAHPQAAAQPATPSEPPAVVALVRQRAKPSKQDVAAALALSGTARAQKLIAGQTLDLMRPVSVVGRIEVQKVKIKNDVGSIQLKLTEAISLESGRVVTDKTVTRQLCLYRRGEVWVICDSQERFYLPQDQALNAFERQAEIFLRQAPSGSGTRSVIKTLDILYDREAALRQRAALK